MKYTEEILICLLILMLLAISIIDWKTFKIPWQLNAGILILGIVKIFFVTGIQTEYIFGLFVVSIPLLLLFLLTRGAAIGGGDIKLMAAAGLFLGSEKAVWALFLGCFLGVVIHSLRIKLQGADRELAMGPYLAAGIIMTVLFG